MKEQPMLTTARLILRPYVPSDAKELQRLIGDRAVADTNVWVSHPYTDDLAEEFIGKRQFEFEENKSVMLAITDRVLGFFIGGIGLTISIEHQKAEIGYWLGVPFWHNGYCTEAVRAVLKYGFGTLGLYLIYATHMTRNPRSGNVMQKIGMKHEGQMRQVWKRWDKFEDGERYSILRSEFDNLHC